MLDLGCGAGLDALLAARQVGLAGRVIGVDMTPEMIVLARRHAAEAAVTNAGFRLATMEDLPVQDSSIDVVISNCAGSLSPANDRLLAEARRVQVPGGRLAVADLAIRGALPASVRDWLAAWGGIAGALTVEAYHAAVTRAGFTGVAVRVLHTFGLADIEMVESTSLGGEGLSGLPEEDLRAADGIVASVYITATRPASEVLAGFQSMFHRPDEVEMQLGVSFHASFGMVIANASSGAHLEVTLRWSADHQRVAGEDDVP